ncbi:hypothetical protein AB684_14290 [Bacillus licheniformis]|nr:RNA polymerase sigma factor [Bacillus licheniformis WX-02]AMR11291.1 hypothetical protein AB684_14290 [Bacillus licheniformis]APJ27776.1 hypothetical protein BSZ43_13740 [Bacillus sp. H15-1]OAG80164.1 hypothetical protein AWE49_13630 [Bacillus licheniformis]OIS80351.1 hypothetical protein A4A40_11065 [Bacillus licheniformis]
MLQLELATLLCAALCIENEILMHLRTRKKTQKDVSLYEPIGQDQEEKEVSLINMLKSKMRILSPQFS